jgi:hypothetical protein
MAFFPEGQADRSQARSAWVAMPRGFPVPEGRSKSWSVPQRFVVETEPRHEQATARRMLPPLQKRQVLLWKRLGPMGSVQSSRWDGAIFLMIPGTSCLATIVLSLRDKTIRPSTRASFITFEVIAGRSAYYDSGGVPPFGRTNSS